VIIRIVAGTVGTVAVLCGGSSPPKNDAAVAPQHWKKEIIVIGEKNLGENIL
jgi:hypothetical protein